MEYNRGIIDGLTLALVALNTAHFNPESYEEVKAVLEKRLKSAEEDNEQRLEELNRRYGKK